MPRSLAHALVAVVFTLALIAPRAAHADIQTKGPEQFPGKNEISLHIGGQTGLSNYTLFDGRGVRIGAGAPPSGFRFTFDYGYQLKDFGAYSLWLDLGFNFVFGGCTVTFAGAVYACNGDEFRPFGGVKAKFRTPIPLVPYASLTAGSPIIFARYCGDNGFGVVGRLGGGAKYFLTKSIGLGLDMGFSLGPEWYSGAPANDTNCFNNGYFYGSHVQFYAAFDIQAGAEFVF